ncbi:hypothetical protein K402DRAFT_396933 [Aulographum hederae CBS 113979]|uniref:Uncharacterized protein n=1 Tax=Aulographum hederae CBS 113979 TaxID=1176131 RepID=A0A6G1GQM3_9PEZI|nr:hypothetical protein K402DRAFT_396933 [Aulographum hederae CBS 113979]
MSSIITSIRDLFASLIELITSIFRTIIDLITTVITSLFNFVTGFFTMVFDSARGVVNGLGGLGKFVISNFVVLAIIALAGVFYLQFQRNQGKTVKVGNKKIN